jgi:hypothetical protein
VADLARRTERFPTGHISWASLAGEQALLAHARGQLDRAMTADQAVAIAEASIRGGTQLSRALLRRSDIARAAGQLDRATADGEAALRLELRGHTTGDFSNLVGLCHLALGRALQQQHKIDEARTAFARRWSTCGRPWASSIRPRVAPPPTWPPFPRRRFK